MEGNTNKPPHVAIVCSSGIGHVIPLAEFGALLASRHSFNVTLIASPIDPSAAAAYRSIATSLPSQVNSITRPFPPPDYFPEHTHRIPHRQPSPTTSLAALASIVVDLFSFVTYDLAFELGIPCYMFCTSTCMSLSLFLRIPLLHETYHEEEYRNLVDAKSQSDSARSMAFWSTALRGWSRVPSWQ
ncbi:hydroquinone glucosyltransferase-like [Typha angustifolia]|uniref:hydroquinone glucosyltransferase-like n=1 Tax=Typha angustifolia TaxID=59011 RepID=UPI003C2D81DB